MTGAPRACTQRGVLQTLTIDELLGKLNEKGVVLRRALGRRVPPRPPAASHVVPFTELLDQLDKLLRTSTVAAYYRGRFCVFADEATQPLSVLASISYWQTDD